MNCRSASWISVSVLWRGALFVCVSLTRMVSVARLTGGVGGRSCCRQAIPSSSAFGSSLPLAGPTRTSSTSRAPTRARLRFRRLCRLVPNL